MFQVLKNSWRVTEIRKKILYTIMIIAIFRIGSIIPVPFIDIAALKAGMQSVVSGEGIGSFLSYINILTGGGLEYGAIFAMSVTPYINASIIMQLLSVAIPALERISKEGEEGRKVIAKWTRYVTVILAFIQATGLYFGLRNAVVNPGLYSYITIVATFTAGTAFLIWLGEQITEKGVGNGISIIIFAGIVSGVPGMVNDMYQNYIMENLNIWGILGIVLFIIAMIVFVVFINDAERRIPVQYAKRMVGRKMYGGQSTHIPIKVALAGVIPIIFAMSILAFPTTIMQFTGGMPTQGFWGAFWRQVTSGWVYIALYFLLIVFFTYFYTAIQFNPIEIANNMKRNGGSIPGIRSGKPTSDYISRILTRVTLAGAMFLAIVAVIPMILGQVVGFRISIGGSSLLIMVGVALETVKQIESQMLMRHYKGFLE